MIILKRILRMGASIASYALFLLTLLSAFGGRISPHITALPSMLVLVFPYLFIATFVVGVIWLIARRFIPAIAAASVLVITWTASPDAVPLSFHRNAKPHEKSFTLLSWNVMEFIDNTTGVKPQKRDTVSPTLSYLINSGADIICLEETATINYNNLKRAARRQLDTLRQIYPYSLVTKENDITLFSKYPARLAVSGLVDGSYYALFNLRIQGERVDILGVHLTSYSLSSSDVDVVSDIHGIRSARSSMNTLETDIRPKLAVAFEARATAARYIRGVLDSIPGAVILCGDFNDVPASWVYRTLKGSDMHDAYTQTGFGPLVTYNDHFFWFHIDQILYRGPLRALRVDKVKTRTSDHYPLLTTFALEPPSRQP